MIAGQGRTTVEANLSTTLSVGHGDHSSIAVEVGAEATAAQGMSHNRCLVRAGQDVTCIHRLVVQETTKPMTVGSGVAADGADDRGDQSVFGVSASCALAMRHPDKLQ